jgi:ABC-type nitrate/sulfonate/bicarbonate transport system permease component
MAPVSRTRPLLAVLARGASLAVLLIAWELSARAQFVSAFLMPAASAVAERIVADTLSGDLLGGLGLTLYRAIAGFALAAAGGIALGITIARISWVRWFFDPLVSIGMPMPKIAFLPVFMLWFGLFDASKILLVAFSAIFPVIVASWSATDSVDQLLIWSARSAGAGERRLLWEIVLPAALPQIMTGLQVALPIALVVTIVCEMAMGGEGLGGSIMKDMRFADSPGVFAGIVEIALAGALLVKAMEVLRRRLLVWHQEARG